MGGAGRYAGCAPSRRAHCWAGRGSSAAGCIIQQAGPVAGHRLTMQGATLPRERRARALKRPAAFAPGHFWRRPRRPRQIGLRKTGAIRIPCRHRRRGFRAFPDGRTRPARHGRRPGVEWQQTGGGRFVGWGCHPGRRGVALCWLARYRSGGGQIKKEPRGKWRVRWRSRASARQPADLPGRRVQAGRRHPLECLLVRARRSICPCLAARRHRIVPRCKRPCQASGRRCRVVPGGGLDARRQRGVCRNHGVQEMRQDAALGRLAGPQTGWQRPGGRAIQCLVWHHDQAAASMPRAPWPPTCGQCLVWHHDQAPSHRLSLFFFPHPHACIAPSPRRTGRPPSGRRRPRQGYPLPLASPFRPLPR